MLTLNFAHLKSLNEKKTVASHTIFWKNAPGHKNGLGRIKFTGCLSSKRVN